MKPKVSIIIPVYNAEKQIKTCIKSIQAQTYKSIEIITVNDGSDDRSRHILQTMARKDKRIIVLNHRNKGPGYSRNRGIAYATGSYVQFVDADDRIHPEMTADLISGMTPGTDLVICGIMYGKKKIVPHVTGSLHGRVFLDEFGELYKDMIIPSPCNKLYRADLLHKFDLRFPHDLHFGEDLLFNLHYFNQVKRVTILERPLYRYHLRDHSLTHRYIDNLYIKYKELYKQMHDFLTRHGALTETNEHFLGTQFAQAVIQSAANLYNELAPFNKTERIKALNEILTDPILFELSSYFTGSRQAQLFRHFITRKMISEANIYLVVIRGIKKTPILYHLIRRINRRN